MIGNRFYWANNSKVKIIGNAVFVGGEKCGWGVFNSFPVIEEVGKYRTGELATLIRINNFRLAISVYS